jgi:hypothetical protein
MATRATAVNVASERAFDMVNLISMLAGPTPARSGRRRFFRIRILVHGVKISTMRPTCCLAGIVALVALGSSKGAAQQERVPADLVITLERTACYGECPVYRVSIDASGKVTFQGTSFVRAKGLQTDTIPDSSVAALIATANRIGFFGLRESYRAPITDLSTTIVTITAGGRTKRVEDYFSAPGELKQFEHAIDEAARTQRWIRIDASTVRRFVREGRLVSPGEQAELLRHAVDQDDVDVVQELLRSGADPNTAVESCGSGPASLSSVRPSTAITVPSSRVRGLIDVTAPTRVPPTLTSLPTTSCAALGTSASTW